MIQRSLLCLLACNTMVFAQTSPPAPSPSPFIQDAVTAVGGADKLLKLFRMKEIFHFGDKPEPPAGKQRSVRESVCEAPKNWWIGTKDRTGEPAKFDVWAWTLGAITDPQSKVEVVPDVIEDGKAAYGLRVSGTITPAMELYFDRNTKLLVRMDWRSDIYRFSNWKEVDGLKYASRCVLYKKAGNKPWFFHDITSIERLSSLPDGLSRE